jgi:hypothetical protein
MAMEIIRDNLWLCDDCLMVAVNGDESGIASDDLSAVRKGIRELGNGLVPDFDSETEAGIDEFSSKSCDCCRSKLAGPRHRFSILG